MSMELSDLLAKLSQQAKKVEDGFADIAAVTDAAAEERRNRAEAAATATVKQVDEDITSAKAAAADDWRALTARVDNEIKSIQADIARRKHEQDVSKAEQHAEAAKERAEWAAAFAAAALDTANLAVADYDVARREAEAIKRTGR